jgi:4-hydroxy-tetrahydrodipicolinate reductase
VVEGTTGWHSSEVAVRDLIESSNTAMVYGANFSLGVNLFYRIVSRAGELFGGFPEYSAFITEAHHERKRDAPSGTALRLREVLGSTDREIPISSTRAGFIPGTHVVGFDSIADQVTLKHEARSREGFAAGAILAANWIVGRQGVYEFSQMIDEMITAKLR